MNVSQILKEKENIITSYGKWTAHNIRISDSIYTIDDNPDSYEDLQNRIKSFLTVIKDLSKKPLEELRIIDLACLEGGYAIEFARRGIESVGIEIREPNIQKALYASKALNLENVSFYKDDVRNLCSQKYGVFDVVFCSGILYHLDEPDVFNFIEKISEVCNGFAIIDTHISLSEDLTVEYKNKKYNGKKVTEHSLLDSQETKDSKVWASINNNEAFYLTRLSLYNALYDAGFTSVYECCVPFFWNWTDRSTFIAIKGDLPETLHSGLPEYSCEFHISPSYKNIWSIIKKRFKHVAYKNIERFKQ